METSYQNLLVWKKSIELVKHIYNVTKTFPREELYSLTDQLKRSSTSIPANIAEGSQRSSYKEFVHFLFIAKGSAAEVETFLMIVNELGYLKEDDFVNLKKLILEILKMLSSLIKSINPDSLKTKN